MNDPKHEAKVSEARATAEKNNQKALEALRPWDVTMDHWDVDESNAKLYKVTKSCMGACNYTIYVDGKPAKSAHMAGDIIAVTMKKPKTKKAPKADPVKASKK